jgi:uncharacterized membrane protein
MPQLQLQRPLSKGSLILLFVLTAIGFIDAAYLTVEHFVNAVPPCSIGSCETVLTSSYSVILGIPVSLLGALYYLAVLVLLVVFLDIKKEMPLAIAYWLSGLGAIISLVFIALQAFVIHAYCVYCMTSDVLSVILFIAFILIVKKHRTPLAP